MSTNFMVNSLKDFEPFFGNDKKGGVFVQTLYNGNDYVNRGGYQSAGLTELLKASNYANYNSVSGSHQQRDDVHQDVTDLIITTALFHSKLDIPNNTDSRLSSINSYVNESIKKVLTDNKSVFDLLVKILKGEETEQSESVVVKKINDEITKEVNQLDFSQFKNILNVSNQYDTIVDQYKSKLNDELHENFKNGISKIRNDKINITSDNLINSFAVNATIVKINNDLFNYKTATLESAVPREFFETIFSAWPDTDSNIKDFFCSNMNIMELRNENNVEKWVALTTAEFHDLMNNKKERNYAKLRINLKKIDKDNKRMVLFASNLPDVPENVNVWYSMRDKSIACVEKPPADFFRHLYCAFYKKNVTDSDDHTIAVALNGFNEFSNSGSGQYILRNIEFDYKLRPLEPFNLNYAKFISATIARENAKYFKPKNPFQSTPNKLNVTSGIETFAFNSDDFKTVDSVFGNIWNFDKSTQKYYKVDENGLRVYFNEAKADTCYGSYLAKQDPVKCERIMNCLLGDNVNSIAKCIDIIGDSSAWEVAEEDVKNIAPDMLRKMLKNFNIKLYKTRDQNNREVILPITYKEWVETVVSEMESTLKSTILKNDSLLLYIKNVISIVRANPSILNPRGPTTPNGFASDTMSIYSKNLDMKKYRIPIKYKDQSTIKFFIDSLKSVPITYVNTEKLSRSIFDGRYGNVNFFDPSQVLNTNFEISSQIFPNMPFGMNSMPFGMNNGRILGNVLPMQFGGAVTDLNDVIKHSTITELPSYTFNPSQKYVLENSSSSMVESLLETLQKLFAENNLKLNEVDAAKIKFSLEQLKKYEKDFINTLTMLITVTNVARIFGLNMNKSLMDNPVNVKLDNLTSVEDVKDLLRVHARNASRELDSNVNFQRGIIAKLVNDSFPKILSLTLTSEDGKNEKQEFVAKQTESKFPNREFVPF